MRGAGRRLFAAASLVAAVACGGGGPAGPGDAAPEDAGHEEGEQAHADAIEARTDLDITHRVGLAAGNVAAVRLPPFEVHEHVVVRDVTVRTESGEVELLAARFADGAPGARCVPGWPLVEAGAVRPVAGAAFADGDEPSLLLYLRPRGTGPVVVDEARVAYDVDGRPAELTWRAFRIELRPAPKGC